MSNEPVVYISEATLKHCLEGNEICVRQNDELDDVCTIPLYTHPVKELTIHEDIVYGLAYKYGIEKGDVLDFARALLKKASER